MKQFACWFTHGVGNGGELRRIVHAARTPSEVVESVERFFVDRFAVAGKDDRAAAVGDGLVVPGKPDRSAVAGNEDPAYGPSQHHRCETALGT